MISLGRSSRGTGKPPWPEAESLLSSLETSWAGMAVMDKKDSLIDKNVCDTELSVRRISIPVLSSPD
jgi:hypothetical protein